MIARNYALPLLLLLSAAAQAAGPNLPDSRVGRQAFNRCLAQAETAWRTGHTADALWWYHSAKKVARSHRLTLTDRDVALIAFVARHEAGLAGPQPGSKPGCDTDGTPLQSTKPTLRSTRGPLPDPASRPLGTRIIPPTGPEADPFPVRNTRSIPSTTSVATEPPGPPELATTTPSPTGNPPPPEKPVASKAADTTSKEPAPPPATPPTPRKGDVARDDELVPPVTPARTSAPPAPQRKTNKTETAGLTETATAELTETATAELTETATADPTETETADPVRPSLPVSNSETSATLAAPAEHPVKLAVDRTAVPIKVTPESRHSEMSASRLPSTPPRTTAAGTPPSLPGSTPDHQIILLMFGPIVVALFILGLLTQEMPSPSRIMTWMAARLRRTPPGSKQAIVSITGSPADDSSADDHAGQVMLAVKIESRQRNKVAFYTATIELPGLEPARLVKRRDGSPLFRSRAAAVSSARHLARRLGFDGISEPVARRRKAA